MIAVFYLIAMNTNCKVFRHLAALYGFDTNCFQCQTKIDQFLVIIQLATEGKSPGPRKNRSDRVGGGWLSSLVVAIVSCYGAVCSFCFHGASIGRDQYRRH